MSSDLVKKHFFTPQNVGEIEGADGVGRAGSIICGAALRVSLSIDESQRVAGAKFKAAGCSYLVAACSFLTDAVMGKTTGEAAALYQSEEMLIERMSSDWPCDRTHCAALAREALIAAIRTYSDAVRNEWSGDEALICTCFGVSEHTIERAIQTASLHTNAEVTNATNAGAGCRSCCPLIQDMLDLYWRENSIQIPANHS
ncbi:MAG: iron-sulfur cluster assembly scaffold protein [Pyrinomonadaceae bacterium]